MDRSGVQRWITGSRLVADHPSVALWAVVSMILYLLTVIPGQVETSEASTRRAVAARSLAPGRSAALNGLGSPGASATISNRAIIPWDLKDPELFEDDCEGEDGLGQPLRAEALAHSPQDLHAAFAWPSRSILLPPLPRLRC
jgi:hypothetical protein